MAYWGLAALFMEPPNEPALLGLSRPPNEADARRTLPRQVGQPKPRNPLWTGTGSITSVASSVSLVGFGLVTTSEVRGVTKLYWRERSRAFCLLLFLGSSTSSFSSSSSPSA